jgi:hypothetical protein
MTLILNGTDNSATTPAVTGTDTDTGVYYPAANQVALATNGAQAMLANASQGVQFANAIGVGATTPTTSGAGITFPATQSASTDANTLDDYEEGSFTPTVTGGAGSASSVTAIGSYVKIGRTVTIVVFLSYAKNTLTGNVGVGGFPFTAEGAIYGEVAMLIDQMATTYVNPLLQITAGSTSAVAISGNGSTGTHTALDWSSKNSAQGTLRFSATYTLS